MRPLLAVLPLVLLTACSGGGSGSSGPSLQEQRDAYLQQAESVCQKANEQVSALGTPTSITAVPEFADKAVAIVQTTVQDLSALQPPAADREDITAKVLDPLQQDVTTAKDYAAQAKDAAARGDGAALLRLLQSRPQTSADLSFMRQYGFDECVKAADQKD